MMHRRVVKSFDFDERKSGNVEDIPMYWHRHLAEGFPHYLEGRFDPNVGHLSGPAFHLGLNGGNIAYVYRGDDIPVYTSSDYLVHMWVRPDRLVHARAYATAFYCDRDGKQLPGTEQRSRLVGGVSDGADWQELSVVLPGGYAEARQLGVGLWVVQSPMWSGVAPKENEVLQEDFKGGAWFDDINVIRLPRVFLDTGQPGNVFSCDQKPTLRAEVHDPDGTGLEGDVEVQDVTGKRLLLRSIRMPSKDAPGQEDILLGSLPPGVYRARLRVRTGQQVLSERQLTFACLSPRLNATGTRNTGFGLVLDPSDTLCRSGVMRLMGILAMNDVKVPLDPSLPVRGAGMTTAKSLSLVEGLWRDGIKVSASLPPVTSRPAKQSTTKGSTARPLIQTLAGKPDTWGPDLAHWLVQYGDFIQNWQLGPDGDENFAWNPQLLDVLKSLQKNVTGMVPSFAMVIPWPVQHQSQVGALQAYDVSLWIPCRVGSEQIPSYMKDFHRSGVENASAVMQWLQSDRYDRMSRLGDLAKRLIFARLSTTGVVYVPRPWEVVAGGDGHRIEPREELILVRTVSELLSDATYVGELHVRPTVRCLMFNRRGKATVALWDDTAPAEGRTEEVHFGAATQRVDLWGQVSPIQSVNGAGQVRLTATPVFITGAESWHLWFQSSFAMVPPHVECSTELHECEIRFRNPRDKPLSGMVRLKPPPGWEVRPLRIPFFLAPRQEYRSAISIQFPLNEIAGPKTLTGAFIIDTDNTGALTAQAPFSLGLKDIDVRCEARLKDGQVVVTQSLTNHANRFVEVEAYVSAPGRSRLTHLYRPLESGQSVQKRFILEDGRRLAGRSLRVGLREVRGSRMLNQIVVVQ